MKNILILTIVFISAICYSQGQTSTIRCIYRYEKPFLEKGIGDLTARQDSDQFYRNMYPNDPTVIFIPTGDGAASSNFSFDCMSYSIYIYTFQGDTLQIGDKPDDWANQGMIKKVTDIPQNGDIVFYCFGDTIHGSRHSAIVTDINVTSNPADDMVRSKWANGPFVDHLITKCPWYIQGTTNLIYYRKKLPLLILLFRRYMVQII